MFDPCVDKTLELLNDQFIQASDEGFNVRVSTVKLQALVEVLK
jgi:hypothetical protein